MASWSITPVDVGGLINVYEGAKDRRLKQMLTEREIAKEDREIEKQARIADVYGRLFKPKGGDPQSAGSGAVVSPPSTAPGLVDTNPNRTAEEAAIELGIDPGIAGAYGAPPPPIAMNPDGSPPAVAPVGGPVAPTALIDPAQLPPRTDGVTLNQDAMRELFTLDPKSALDVQKNVFDMNAAQLKAVTENGERIASVAYHLSQVPAAERAAELQAMAPVLAQSGIDASMLAQADLSDRGLQRYLRIGQAYKDLVKDERDERKFEADERHRREQERIAQGGLDVRRGALGIAKQREGRVASGGGRGGAGGDVTGLSTEALINMAGGN